jgi:uroporphyrinogen-III decarboxylase
MDVCELLWGSDLFLALYDQTDLVHSLLAKISDTYEAFLDAWFQCSPPRDELHSYFGHAHLGAICVRDDSAMNLSPEMYREFILPYNDRILTHFGGGAIHSCGRVDHFVPLLREMPDLKGFNMSQPEYNDMEVVYTNTVDAGIPVIGLDRDAVLAAPRDLKGLVSTSWAA